MVLAKNSTASIEVAQNEVAIGVDLRDKALLQRIEVALDADIARLQRKNRQISGKERAA